MSARLTQVGNFEVSTIPSMSTVAFGPDGEQVDFGRASHDDAVLWMRTSFTRSIFVGSDMYASVNLGNLAYTGAKCEQEISDGNPDDPSYAYCGLPWAHAGLHGAWYE